MNILILGDIMGPSGNSALVRNLKKVVDQNQIEFVIVNGENAAEDGLGITNQVANNIFVI